MRATEVAPGDGSEVRGPRILLAAWDPRRRQEALRRALEALVSEAGLSRAALVLASPEDPEPWRTVRAGRWSKKAEGRLRSALAEPGVLPWARPGDAGLLAPVAVALGTGPGGLLLAWPDGRGDAALRARVEGFARELEPVLEVERRERLLPGTAGSPGEELARAVREGELGALPGLLALARSASAADLSYWGGVHDGVVDVEWHVGARDSGFGFELPLGQGVGGRAFVGGREIGIPDYLNCQYRYPGVSDVTDGEDARSVFAAPVRGAHPRDGAVLYAVRREVEPFSVADRILLNRIARALEPLPAPGGPARRRSLPPREDPVAAARAEMRRLLLDATSVQEAEAWLSGLARGPAILADHAARPYVAANAGRLEALLGSREPLVVPLAATADGAHAPGGRRGGLHLWPSVELPPAGWPDLLEDAAAVCGVILDRAERAYDRLDRARSRWLRDVVEGIPGPATRREGNRLGLPVDRGEVWAVAWSRDADDIRRRMLAEDAALDRLGTPLISADDGVGVLLLKEGIDERPAAVRDDLLRFFGPSPLWLVHGATYDSLERLKESLSRSLEAVERLRRDGAGRYVSEVGSWGLDSLLENPRVSAGLDEFAHAMLEPLLLRDDEAGSRLTETFCLALTEGPAEAAKRLFVHENTVRYRVRRAAEALGCDLDSPKERTALTLAAFAWLRRHDR